MLDSDAIRRGQASALQGNLSQIPLGEVCRLLRSSHRTGTLYLREGGRIHVQEGKITHAEVGELSGAAAFFELMRTGRGDFEFRAGLPGNLQHSISMSTSTLLENAAQELAQDPD
jgi:hypothetical protein